MSQASGRPCPTCGTNVPAGQRFCSNCGTDIQGSQPASQYGGPPPQNYPSAQPIPPYAQSPYGQQQQYQQYQQPQQKSNPIAEALAALGLLFFLRRYRPGYRARRQSSGCCGCLVTLIILLAIFGAPAYFYYRANPHILQQIQQNINNSNNGELPTKQPPITTANINQSVTYAGVAITILSVQQSTAFIDDSSSANNGVIRINLKENGSADAGSYAYSEIARLILPDKSAVAPLSEQNSTGPGSSTTRMNWLDFAVPTSVKINSLTLQLGSDTQAQMNIPLTGKANLQALQPITASPNKSTQYAGLTWTITSATLAWNDHGQQADKGMRYVVVTLKVDNPSAHNFSAYYGDYIRLKAGDAISAPTTNSTLGTSFPANSSGMTGTVNFQVPEGVTSFTLTFLANSALQANQSTIDFQI